jgi:hypothetical protein
LNAYRDGATPSRFGIRPLKRPGTPSYLIICLNFKVFEKQKFELKRQIDTEEN